MNNWIAENDAALRLGLSVGLGLLLLILGIALANAFLLTGSLLMFVIAVIGDRLKKAPGGWEFYRGRIASRAKAERPPPTDPKVVVRTAEDSLTTTDRVEGQVVRAPTVDNRGKVFPPTVVQGSFTADAVIAAAKSLDTAKTPEELADRLIEYVEIRSVPGLRGLSTDRIRLEQELFGAILELQSLRKDGYEPSDEERLEEALRKIVTFWDHPERLADQEVGSLTTLVRDVIAGMTRGDL